MDRIARELEALIRKYDKAAKRNWKLSLTDDDSDSYDRAQYLSGVRDGLILALENIQAGQTDDQE